MVNKVIKCKKCDGEFILRETLIVATDDHDNVENPEWVRLYERRASGEVVYICRTCGHEWKEG